MKIAASCNNKMRILANCCRRCEEIIAPIFWIFQEEDPSLKVSYNSSYKIFTNFSTFPHSCGRFVSVCIFLVAILLYPLCYKYYKYLVSLYLLQHTSRKCTQLSSVYFMYVFLRMSSSQLLCSD